MISEDLRQAIIEGDIRGVAFIVLKESNLMLHTEYHAEALELAKKNQNIFIIEFLQFTILKKTLDAKMIKRNFDGLQTIKEMKRTEMITLLKEIRTQLYKCYHSVAGEFTPLSSSVALRKGFFLYATRNDLGEHQIIAHKNNAELNQYEYYQILKESVVIWDPIDSIKIRLNKALHEVPDSANLSEQERLCLPRCYDLIISKLREMFSTASPTHLVLHLPEINRELQVVFSSKGEFRILLSNHENDFRSFVELGTKHAALWQKHKETSLLLPKEAIEFVERVENALVNLSKESTQLPAELNGRVDKEIILNVYKFLLKTPKILEKLSDARSFRIDKCESDLKRTFNVVLCQSGEYALILETKRKKLNSNNKDLKQTIGSGTYGTVKTTWRIDLKIFEEWANKTTQSKTFLEAEYETTLLRNLYQHITKEELELFNTTSLGELFYKNETPKHSQYSKRAIGSLDQVLEMKILSIKNILYIFIDILKAIDVLHRKGIVHQDIKAKNILIYERLDYYGKLADFGLSEDMFRSIGFPAITTCDFASPEILISTQSKQSAYYRDYHLFSDRNSFVYASYLESPECKLKDDDPLAIHYRLPDPANDMWALGILLFFLQKNRFPTFASKDRAFIEKDRLLNGLLKINRKDRLTSQEALEIYAQWLNEKLSSPPIVYSFDAYKGSPSTKEEDSPSIKPLSVVTLDGQRIELLNFISRMPTTQLSNLKLSKK